MTRKIFWENPYLIHLETRIASVTGAEVTVEATILYAESGGQESDHGSIGGRPVLNARWDEHEIIYTLPPDHGLQPGDTVWLKLDWPRRYRLMRLHFAAEIILELVYQHLEGVEKIGAHISEDKARIDFVWPDNIARLFPLLRERADQIIAADLPILSAYSDEPSEQRYWEVEGLGRVPCGGTHLKRTGEVGPFTLKRRNPGKGKERIEITIQDDIAPAPGD